jgi:leader peptidase (prepilin peptidase)/N-methyltransferase
MLLVLVFIFGVIIGSLINVISLRLPKILDEYYQPDSSNLFSLVLKGLSLPASHCPTCKTPLKYQELIPIVSYILQKARCTNCKTKISLQYPLVEITCGLLAIWCWLSYPNIAALFIFIFFTSLLTLALIDLKHQTLPDEITLPLLWGGLLVNVFNVFVPLTASVIGAIVGYLALWLVYQIHFFITKREGLGYGDFKLLAAIGAWLGWQQLPLVLLTGSLLAIIYFVTLMLMKKIDRSTPIAFGPFLALGAWVSISLSGFIP